MEHPLLRRDLQLIPARVQGRRLIAFLDPLRLVDGDLALDMGLYAILELLDGRHSVRDIQRSLSDRFTEVSVTLDRLTSFIESLDKNYLLESERFRARKDRLHKDFGAATDRCPVHAGKAYDADPSALASFIAAVEAALPPPAIDLSKSSIAGILAPHIDIGVAKSTYVDLYRHLRGRHYDRVVILGINHQIQRGLYCLCEKGFITPFGTLETDRPFVEELRQRLSPETIDADDFGHKVEHSIEFQTVFLHYYLAKPFKIVPVLCGGIHEFLLGGMSLFEDQGFQNTVALLSDMISRDDARTLVVAAVDFSHVGLKFGHQNPADVLLQEALESDREILSLLEQGRAEGVFLHAKRTRDQFNVCGLPSIILFAQLMKNYRGIQLAHHAYREAATASAVTYASMVFFDHLAVPDESLPT